MSSEEEDYMSDAFLQKCVDTRPGLAPKRAQLHLEKERRQKEADLKSRSMPRHKLEASKRAEGLEVPVSNSNKGFALLQKMGYKPGMGIGKEGKGRLEPVSIEVKGNRSGLGRESELKRRAKEVNEMRAAMMAKRQRAEAHQRESFTDRISGRFSDNTVKRDLRAAQRACFNLDHEQGLTEPEKSFYWPAFSVVEIKQQKEVCEVTEMVRERQQQLQQSDRHDGSDVDSEDEVEDDEEEQEFSEFEQLDIVSRYLRNVYNYCTWCGTKYEDQEDMLSSCPGNTAEAHD